MQILKSGLKQAAAWRRAKKFVKRLFYILYIKKNVCFFYILFLFLKKLKKNYYFYFYFIYIYIYKLVSQKKCFFFYFFIFLFLFIYYLFYFVFQKKKKSVSHTVIFAKLAKFYSLWAPLLTSNFVSLITFSSELRFRRYWYR